MLVPKHWRKERKRRLIWVMFAGATMKDASIVNACDVVELGEGVWGWRMMSVVGVWI